jgi:deazaflavin-dependent oxidoreductase (nitroreductase family)
MSGETNAASRVRPNGPPRFVNRAMLALLRSPLHGVVSGSVLALAVTGRRTGTRLAFPVQYARDGDRLVVAAVGAAGKRWWRNLRGGAPVEIVLRGRRMRGSGRVLDGEPAAAALRVWAARYPRATARLDDDVAAIVIDGLRPDGPPGAGPSALRRSGTRS